MNREIEYVDPSTIKPDPHQPRTVFDEKKIKEIADSYSNQGVIEPIEVDENNVIILGERRWRASKLAGLKQVPIMRKTGLNNTARLERQLIDDAHRADLTPQEKVWAYATAIVNINLEKEGKSYTVDEAKTMDRAQITRVLFVGRGRGRDEEGVNELSKRLGVSHMTISQYLRYFRVSEKLQRAFDEGKVSIAYLRDVARIDDPSEQVRAENILLEDLSKPEKKRIFSSHADLLRYVSEVNKKVEKTVGKAALEAAEKVAPDVKIETPEDLERAAEALKAKARKLRPEKSAEEKAAIEKAQKEKKIYLLEKEAKRQEKVAEGEAKLRAKIHEEERARLVADTEFQKTAARMAPPETEIDGHVDEEVEAPQIGTHTHTPSPTMDTQPLDKTRQAELDHLITEKGVSQKDGEAAASHLREDLNLSPEEALEYVRSFSLILIVPSHLVEPLQKRAEELHLKIQDTIVKIMEADLT